MMAIPHPALLMIRGLPGSGKSHLATALRDKIGTDDVVILDPDSLDHTDPNYQAFSDQLSQEGLDKAIHPFRWSRQQACEAISAHKLVVWNQPFTNRGMFDRLVAFLQNYANEQAIPLRVLVVEVEIDHAQAQARVAARKQAGGHGPSEQTFARRISEYTSYGDGYDVVTVRGDADVNASVDAVVAALQQ